MNRNNRNIAKASIAGGGVRLWMAFCCLFITSVVLEALQRSGNSKTVAGGIMEISLFATTFMMTGWLKYAILTCFTIKILCGDNMAGAIWKGKFPKDRRILSIGASPACCQLWNYRALPISWESKTPTCQNFIPVYKMYVFLDFGRSKSVSAGSEGCCLLSGQVTK